MDEKKPSLGLALLLSLILSCNALGQASVSEASIIVRRFEATKLVDRQRQPQQIEAKISLQTQGKAIYRLDLFYRNSADAPFERVRCDLLPNLKYYARLPYSVRIEYYLVATPMVGGPTKVAGGSIVGPDLEPSRLGIEPGTGYFVAGTAAVVALVTAALINSDRAATNPHANPSPVPYVAAGAAVGSAIAAVVIWKNRHKKYKDIPVQPAAH